MPASETERQLHESVEKYRGRGFSELDAMAYAAQDALNNHADIGDVLNAFATRSWVDRKFWLDNLKREWLEISKYFTDEDFNINVGAAPIVMGKDADHPRSGLNPQIDDDTRDQMGHIFAYIRYAYLYSGDIARAANESHDYPLEWDPNGSPEAAISLTTKEDYVAGLKGASIGEKLKKQGICLEDFGDFMRKSLGPDNNETDQMTKEAERRRDELLRERAERRKEVLDDEGGPWQ